MSIQEISISPYPLISSSDLSIANNVGMNLTQAKLEFPQGNIQYF